MIIVKSTEQAMELIREMEGESHLVEDEPYLIEEDRAHHGRIIIDGSGSRYVIHPVSGEIGIYYDHSSTKSIEKWTEAGGRDWDTICEMTKKVTGHIGDAGCNRALVATGSVYGTPTVR